jgi:hypothetical protein
MFNGDTASMISQGPALLDKANNVLDLILEALDTRVEQIAVTDVSTDPGLQKDFPTPGSQRWILHRTPDGRTLALPTELTDVLPANVNRLGGTIVNSGAKPARLYLATVSTKNAGSAPVWLGAEGGSWDFRLGNLLWSGSVCAIALGGAETQLEVTEV